MPISSLSRFIGYYQVPVHLLVDGVVHHSDVACCPYACLRNVLRSVSVDFEAECVGCYSLCLLLQDAVFGDIKNTRIWMLVLELFDDCRGCPAFSGTGRVCQHNAVTLLQCGECD